MKFELSNNLLNDQLLLTARPWITRWYQKPTELPTGLTTIKFLWRGQMYAQKLILAHKAPLGASGSEPEWTIKRPQNQDFSFRPW